MAKKANLVRPGILGRAIRVVLGAATLSLTYSLLTNLRTMWSGDMPIGALDFWVAMALTFGLTGWVVSELAAKPWGQKPLLVGLAAGAVFSLLGLAIDGNLFGSVFTTYLWTWATALTLLLGVTLVVAGVAAQPGCEMRVYASMAARAKGGNPEAVACKGGIDRWDHIGSPDSK